jgi:hypothetical protein
MSLKSFPNDHATGMPQKEARSVVEIRHWSRSHKELWLCPVVAAEALHTRQKMCHMRSQGASAQMRIYKYDRTKMLKKDPPASVVCQYAGMEHLWCC